MLLLFFCAVQYSEETGRNGFAAMVTAQDMTDTYASNISPPPFYNGKMWRTFILTCPGTGPSST